MVSFEIIHLTEYVDTSGSSELEGRRSTSWSFGEVHKLSQGDFWTITPQVSGLLVFNHYIQYHTQGFGFLVLITIGSRSFSTYRVEFVSVT